MPKIEWINRPGQSREDVTGDIPAPDTIKELFERYQKAKRITSQDLADALGTSAANIRGKKHRGWTKEARELSEWCAVLGIPPEELGWAIVGSREYRKRWEINAGNK